MGARRNGTYGREGGCHAASSLLTPGASNTVRNWCEMSNRAESSSVCAGDVMLFMYRLQWLSASRSFFRRSSHQGSPQPRLPPCIRSTWRRVGGRGARRGSEHPPWPQVADKEACLRIDDGDAVTERSHCGQGAGACPCQVWPGGMVRGRQGRVDGRDSVQNRGRNTRLGRQYLIPLCH